jgi:hypothetical protein
LERSKIPPFVENLAAYASLASLPSLVITYLVWIRKPGIGRTVILFFVVPVALAAYLVDISDRLGWIKLSETGDVIEGWGRHDSTLFINVNSRSLVGYKDKFKMMLISKLLYTDIDKMTDTAIEKSSLFTITGDRTTIAVVASTTHLRVVPPPNNKVGDVFDRVCDFSLVILPNNLSVDQIRSLSDVETLGGKIIATYATNVQFQVGEKPAG